MLPSEFLEGPLDEVQIISPVVVKKTDSADLAEGLIDLLWAASRYMPVTWSWSLTLSLLSGRKGLQGAHLTRNP